MKDDFDTRFKVLNEFATKQMFLRWICTIGKLGTEDNDSLKAL